MVRLYPSEVFKEVIIDYPLKKRYAVSNYGRLVSFNETVQDGSELKGGTCDGYRTLSYKMRIDGAIKNKHLFLYKIIGEFFVPKSSDEQTHVIHLDHSRDNDKVSNLRWVTRAEMLAHSRKSPRVIATSKLFNRIGKGKLTSTQVIHIKKRLLDPNRKTRVKILAKQFGVSEMQLHRIRTGENWGHIIV